MRRIVLTTAKVLAVELFSLRERSLVRSLSRQQQALSLSSCEAELYGLQSVCQESVAFGRLVHRLLFALHEIDEPEEVVIWLESDSSSALQLVRSMDVP